MTWETLGDFDEEGFVGPEVWLVFRVEKRSEDVIELFWVNGDHDAFDELEKPSKRFHGHTMPRDIRRKWERALKKVAHKVDDEDLYGEVWILQRVPESLLDDASDLFDEVISDQ